MHLVLQCANDASVDSRTVAVQLTDTFRATVLPSYGMAECIRLLVSCKIIRYAQCPVS